MKPKVMIVDDEEVIREFVKSCLQPVPPRAARDLEQLQIGARFGSDLCDEHEVGSGHPAQWDLWLAVGRQRLGLERTAVSGNGVQRVGAASGDEQNAFTVGRPDWK